MSLHLMNAAAPKISVKELSEAISYDPDTGCMTWKERPLSHFHDAGKPAWLRCSLWNGKFAGKPALTCSDPRGYRKGMLNQKMLWAHRVAIALSEGEWPVGEVDHINRDKADNRRENLRVVSHQENAMNRVQGGKRGPRT